MYLFITSNTNVSNVHLCRMPWICLTLNSMIIFVQFKFQVLSKQKPTLNKNPPLHQHYFWRHPCSINITSSKMFKMQFFSLFFSPYIEKNSIKKMVTHNLNQMKHLAFSTRVYVNSTLLFVWSMPNKIIMYKATSLVSMGNRHGSLKLQESDFWLFSFDREESVNE